MRFVTNMVLFYPVTSLLLATSLLCLMAIIALNRKARTVARCLLILSPAAPLFLLSFALTVARALVWWLTSRMPNAPAMRRAVAQLEAEFSTAAPAAPDGGTT